MRMNKLRAALNQQDGQTMAEYAVALAVITVTGVAAFTLLGVGFNDVMADIVAAF